MNKQLSVIVLTKNEEIHLARCLNSLKALNADVYIVDSGSQDATVSIAKEFGACVVSHPFVNHAEQLNWAIQNLAIQTPWTMRLDADEYLSPELILEISGRLPFLAGNVSGIFIKRRVYFWKRWIRFGGYYPIWLLRIWRTGKGSCEERFMDEHIKIDSGQTLRLRHDLIDENLKGLGFLTEKHNGYSKREVEDMKTAAGTSLALSGQAARKRWLKEHLYWKLPPLFRVFAYWVFRYFFLLGFLDGIPGLVFHFLQCFWYRFLVDAKWMEEQRLQKEKHATS